MAEAAISILKWLFIITLAVTILVGLGAVVDAYVNFTPLTMMFTILKHYAALVRWWCDVDTLFERISWALQIEMGFWVLRGASLLGQMAGIFGK